MHKTSQEHKDMAPAREKPQEGENPWSLLLIINIKYSEGERKYNNSKSIF